MRRITAALLAVTMLLSVACAPTPAVEKVETDEELLVTGKGLLDKALDMLFLYKGEMKTDKDAAPYYSPEGRRYYPVVGYRSLAELREHARTVFTDDFCTNILDIWAQEPGKPRYIEREDKLWETTQVGNLGWIYSLVPQTVDIVERDEERCVLSGYSQSLLGEVTREEFLMIKEEAGWRLDNYYLFNRTLPLEHQPTVGDYLAELAGGDSQLYRVTIDGGGNALEVEERMIPPFVQTLAALEYDPESPVVVAELPARVSDDPDDLQLVIYNGSCAVSGFEGDKLYITAPDGSITRLTLSYPGGLVLLDDLMKAARWQLNDF